MPAVLKAALRALPLDAPYRGPVSFQEGQYHYENEIYGQLFSFHGTEIIRFQDLYDQRAESHRQRGIVDPQLDLFRWMLQEYRVSLFAQQLGTSLSVSSQRLEKQWKRITD